MDLIQSAIPDVVVRDESACVDINIQIQMISHKLLDCHFHKHKLSG